MHHSTRARASACRMPPGWFRSRFSYFRSYEPVYSCLFIARKQLRTTSGNRTRVPRPYQSAVAGCAAAAPSSLSAVLRRLPPEPYNPGSMYSPTSFRWECAAVTPSKRVDDTSDAVRRHPTSSDWPDSNRRPPDPQSGALTKLRHNPVPAWGGRFGIPVPRRRAVPFLQGRYPAVGGGANLREASLRDPSRASRTPRDTPMPAGALRSLVWTWRGSNPLPSRCERDALPVELQARKRPPRGLTRRREGCALSNPQPKGCGRVWRARPLYRSLRRTPSWEGGNRTRVWLTAVFPIQLPPRRPVPSSAHCSGVPNGLLRRFRAVCKRRAVERRESNPRPPDLSRALCH